MKCIQIWSIYVKCSAFGLEKVEICTILKSCTPQLRHKLAPMFDGIPPEIVSFKSVRILRSFLEIGPTLQKSSLKIFKEFLKKFLQDCRTEPILGQKILNFLLRSTWMNTWKNTRRNCFRYLLKYIKKNMRCFCRNSEIPRKNCLSDFWRDTWRNPYRIFRKKCHEESGTSEGFNLSSEGVSRCFSAFQRGSRVFREFQDPSRQV